MKANEAPEKIYINPMPNPSDGYVGIAWDEPHRTMVEYTRTDAFVEKACKWIKRIWSDVNDDFKENYIEIVIENFKNFMKGE